MTTKTKMRMKNNNKIFKFGLVGKDISYSLSQKWFNDHGETYEVFDTADLKKAIDYFRKLGYSGFNVTTPYKQEVIDYLDIVESDSVNAVKILDDGTLWGKSFDGIAFYRAYSHLIDNDDWDIGYPNKCAILGNGGVMPVIYKELADEAEVVDIFARNPKDGQLPLKEFNAKNYELIVNTIPFKANIDINFNNKSKFIYFDLNYADDRLVEKAKRNKHCVASVNGLAMLEEQAALSLDWWKDEYR